MNSEFEISGAVHTLKQRSTKRFGPDEKPNRENFDVEFSPAGHVLKRTDYTNAMAIHRTSTCVYDDSGRLIRAQECDGAGTETAISEFEYSEGRRNCITRDAKGIVTGRVEDEFAGELLVCVMNYHASGQAVRLKSFEYIDGKLSKSISKYFALGGALTEQWITSYDSAGRISNAYGLKADGTPLGDGKYAYEYDNQGRRAKVWSFIDLEDIANSVTISEYSNDDSGNWIERINIHQSKAESARRNVTTRELTYFPSETDKPSLP